MQEVDMIVSDFIKEWDGPEGPHDLYLVECGKCGYMEVFPVEPVEYETGAGTQCMVCKSHGYVDMEEAKEVR